MSLLQTFRDGYHRAPPKVRRQFWLAWWEILNAILTLGLMVATAIHYFNARYDRATLTAVLVLWCLALRRSSDNGDGR